MGNKITNAELLQKLAEQDARLEGLTRNYERGLISKQEQLEVIIEVLANKFRLMREYAAKLEAQLATYTELGKDIDQLGLLERWRIEEAMELREIGKDVRDDKTQ